nr:hypothetical protein 5 [Deltaproteobacteria bacterium]
MISLKEALTREEAAEHAYCSVRQIDRAIQYGDLEAYKPGRQVVILPEDLTDWILSKKKKRKVRCRGKKPIVNRRTKPAPRVNKGWPVSQEKSY